MIWQRLALALVAAVMMLAMFMKGRYRGAPPLSALCVEPSSVAWLQVAGAVRFQGVYPLSDIKMTDDAIKMAEPLCSIQYEQALVENVVKQRSAARITIICPADQACGMVMIEPLSAHQSLVLLGSVSLNSATAAELCLVPGIGPALAQRIIEYRQNNGEFARFEELLQVKGIAGKKLKNLKPYLTI